MTDAVFSILAYIGAAAICSSILLFIAAWVRSVEIDRQDREDDDYFTNLFGDDEK